jgi:hypothetical protein
MYRYRYGGGQGTRKKMGGGDGGRGKNRKEEEKEEEQRRDSDGTSYNHELRIECYPGLPAQWSCIKNHTPHLTRHLHTCSAYLAWFAYAAAAREQS